MEDSSKSCNEFLRSLSDSALEKHVSSEVNRILDVESARDAGYKTLALALFEQKRRLMDDFHPFAGLSSDLRRKSAVSNAMIVVPLAESYLRGELSDEDWKKLKFLDAVRLNRAGLGNAGQIPQALRLLRDHPQLEPSGLKAIFSSPDPEKFAREAVRRGLQASEINAAAVRGEVASRTFAEEAGNEETNHHPVPPVSKSTHSGTKLEAPKFAMEETLISEILVRVQKLKTLYQKNGPARQRQIAAALEPVRRSLATME